MGIFAPSEAVSKASWEEEHGPQPEVCDSNYSALVRSFETISSACEPAGAATRISRFSNTCGGLRQDYRSSGQTDQLPNNLRNRTT